jgi:hypothetical protein
MENLFKVKAIINKANNQLNFCVPKKQLSKVLKDKIKLNKNKKWMLKFEGFE